MATRTTRLAREVKRARGVLDRGFRIYCFDDCRICRLELATEHDAVAVDWSLLAAAHFPIVDLWFDLGTASAPAYGWIAAAGRPVKRPVGARKDHELRREVAALVVEIERRMVRTKGAIRVKP